MKTVNGYLIPGLVLVAALGGAASTRAADVGVPAAGANSVVPTHNNWLGPYSGLTLGYLGAGVDIERGAGQSDLELREDALALGAILGYNFASFAETGTSRWLIGVEADLTRTADSGKKTDPILGTVNMDAAWLGSLRLRSGYATERLFLYGTAGVGFSDINVQGAGEADRDKLRAGLALGLGAEMALTETWAARAEGLAYGFGRDKMTIAGESRDMEIGFVTARLGVTRRF